MLKNYLTIAVRNLLLQKAYSVTNIFGLAIGLAGGMLILLYLQHEFSYNRHHTKADFIYKVFLSQGLRGNYCRKYLED